MSAIVPFDEFLAETAAARPEDYAGALAEGARQAGVAAEVARAEFERMKAYILAHYEGVEPVGSYLDANGQTVDCVPFDQQPTVREARRRGIAVARWAPEPPGLPDRPSHGPHPASVAAPEPRCPEGAVPTLRVTLDRLARLGTLDNYFHKPGLPPVRSADGGGTADPPSHPGAGD
jgi:hypothetical protein